MNECHNIWCQLTGVTIILNGKYLSTTTQAVIVKYTKI